MRYAETCLTEDMLSTDNLRTIREAAVYSHADQVILFGSRAAGTHSPKSDIDLAVRIDEGLRYLARFVRCMGEDLHDLLHVDVVNLDAHLPDTMREDISREGIILYEKD